MMCGGSFCVWSILVAAAFLVSGLALSVFASQSHLSQRERLWQYGKPSGFAKGSPFGGAGASAPERASHVNFKENNKL